MSILTAPPVRSFPTVDQGTYIGEITEIQVQDWTATPDQFGRQGHFTLVVRWLLVGQTDETGAPISLLQYVRFETGDRPYSKGARQGKLPWLTEITRAIGVPDLQPGEEVDLESWYQRKARLSILAEQRADGSMHNKINAVSPIKKGAVTAPPRVAAPAPVSLEDEENIPF